MPSQFDRLYSGVGLPVLLQQLGIWAVYRPKARENQPPRDILVICNYERQAPLEDETTERVQERMWVAAWRDVMRGIDAPELGDSLLRAELDDEDSPWSFQGEVRNESSVAWELLFARLRPRRYGPKNSG